LEEGETATMQKLVIGILHWMLQG